MLTLSCCATTGQDGDDIVIEVHDTKWSQKNIEVSSFALEKSSLLHKIGLWASAQDLTQGLRGLQHVT